MIFKDIVKKLYPGNKKAQATYTDEYNSAKTHMTHTSADSYARAVVRDKFKDKLYPLPKFKSKK